MYDAIIGLPDASYGSGATGARIAVGLGDANGTPHGLTADTPTSVAAAGRGGLQFQYSTNRSDSNWQVLAVKRVSSTVTATVTDSAVPFAANGSWWRMRFWSRPDRSNKVIWILERLDAAACAVGEITADIPDYYDQYHQAGLRTLTTTARNFRIRSIENRTPY